MTTETTATTIVPLESRAARRAAQRRARALEEAMRRHPSYQSRTPLTTVHLHSV